MRLSTASITSVIGLPPPTDKLGVQRTLGVINYFSKFVPRLGEKIKVLRQLLKKNSVFDWSDNHAKERAQICKCLSEQPVLAIFDPQRVTKITADALQNGVGAAILEHHHNPRKPVAYASRVMTAAQERYSQIEKEALALVV